MLTYGYIWSENITPCLDAFIPHPYLVMNSFCCVLAGSEIPAEWLRTKGSKSKGSKAVCFFRTSNRRHLVINTKPYVAWDENSELGAWMILLLHRRPYSDLKELGNPEDSIQTLKESIAGGLMCGSYFKIVEKQRMLADKDEKMADAVSSTPVHERMDDKADDAELDRGVFQYSWC